MESDLLHYLTMEKAVLKGRGFNPPLRSAQFSEHLIFSAGNKISRLFQLGHNLWSAVNFRFCGGVQQRPPRLPLDEPPQNLFSKCSPPAKGRSTFFLQNRGQTLHLLTVSKTASGERSLTSCLPTARNFSNSSWLIDAATCIDTHNSFHPIGQLGSFPKARSCREGDCPASLALNGNRA